MSLKDELLKNKLISKKQLKKIKHKERVSNKELGKEEIEKKKQQKEETFQKHKQEQKARDKKLAQEQKDEKNQKENSHKIKRAIDTGEIQNAHGNRRFYFIDNNGKIPFLNVSDKVAGMLEKGKAAIVANPYGASEFVVVDKNSLTSIVSLNQNLVIFYNK